MFTCKFLNLPKVPEHLIENTKLDSLQVLRVMDNPTYYENGSAVETYKSTHYSVTTELEQWIKDNISNTYTDVGIRVTNTNDGQSSSIAHTDLTRNYTLIYNINNANGYIKIWQERGHPLLRNPPGYLVRDYSKLDLVEKIETPNNQWYLLNSAILHSVEGIGGIRVNIQLGFKTENDLVGLVDK